MDTSNHPSQERRRAKSKKRRAWAKVFMRPQTWKALVMLGIWITRVIWLLYRIIEFFRA